MLRGRRRALIAGMKMRPLLVALCLAAALPARAQFKNANAEGEAPGPWQCGTIGIGKQADGSMTTTALKGIAIKVGAHGEAAVAYDLDLCRMAGAWTGKFVTPMNLMSRGEFPTALGEVAFTTAEVPGFQVNEAGASAARKSAADQRFLAADQTLSAAAGGLLFVGQRATPAGAAAARYDFSLKSPPTTEKTPAWHDPRPEPFGPLPAGGPKFKGFYVNGEKVILKWEVAGTEVLEMPGYEQRGGVSFFTRSLVVAASVRAITIDVGDEPGEPGEVPGTTQVENVGGNAAINERSMISAAELDWRNFHSASRFFTLSIQVDGSELFTPPVDGRFIMELPPRSVATRIRLAYWSSSDRSQVATFQKAIIGFAREVPMPTLRELIKGGPARWPEAVVVEAAAAPGSALVPSAGAGVPPGRTLESSPTAGRPAKTDGAESPSSRDDSTSARDERATGAPVAPVPQTATSSLSTPTAAYVVETIPLPEANPWGAPMFVGGFDFFPDGRVAICTFHGDVWIGDGVSFHQEEEGSAKSREITQKSELPFRVVSRDLAYNPSAGPKVTWRRFATGLYHALGLKVVAGEIYVTGRDGITRLRDLNGDGEADEYEAFNHDVMVTRSFHEFVFDLQTDPAGNFYFAKAGPVKNGGRGFDELCAHHGCLFQVSPDGKALEVVATGFRAPNGLGAGPRGELTTGDNEGTWTPVCKINWVKPGGFYGVVPLAHRAVPPVEYDKPLCWLPKRVDNSSGSQVWVPDDARWGPWRGELLHLSYGTGSLFGVLKEEVQDVTLPDCCDRTMQGGVVRFPLQFASGIMRARFNPVDGQLYVAGLRGWQTTGLKNGCLQRVRYTGAPVRMPIAMHVRAKGIELTFQTPLDTAAAADPENYGVEVWNYVWSSAYGSPEVSTLTNAEKPGDAGAEFSKAQMAQNKHDPLTVKSVSISTDERTVTLEIPGLKPVMQMSLKYNVKAADGAEVKGEVVNTIHGFAE